MTETAISAVGSHASELVPIAELTAMLAILLTNVDNAVLIDPMMHLARAVSKVKFGNLISQYGNSL